jgi:hypothetical protein
VTAEGLFRSALDKFENSVARGDPRHQAEQANTLIMFGELLKQWDKRYAHTWKSGSLLLGFITSEMDGENTIQQGKDLLASLPIFAGGSLRLDARVQLPV